MDAFLLMFVISFRSKLDRRGFSSFFIVKSSMLKNDDLARVLILLRFAIEAPLSYRSLLFLLELLLLLMLLLLL